MMHPKIRFKEFKDELQSKTLGSISERIGDGIHATPKYDLTGEFFFVNGNNLVDGGIKLTESTKRLSRDESKKHLTPLTDQTILLSINGTIGNLAFYQGENIVLGKSACYITLKKNIDKQYVYQLLQSPSVRRFFRKELTGSTIKNLSLGTIKTTEIVCPEPEEMTKIGSFLSAVDQKVALLEKKHQLLVDFKKGVMQKIFSRELRFKPPKGGLYPDWISLPLENILGYEQPTDYLVSSTNYSDEFDTPVLTAGKTFLLGYSDEKTGVYSKLPVIIFDDFTTATKYVDFEFKAKSSAMKMLTNLDSKNRLRFIYEAMMQIEFSTGDEHKRYWISEYSKLKIQLPCSEEQEKIEKFSVSLDLKISLTLGQIELCKQYKKSLLQNMFI
jgi:type I restriction enzyme S subunit